MGDITENYHGGNPYSREAYETTPEEHFESIRRKCYDYVKRRGAEGSTADEAQEALSLIHQNSSTRFSELKQMKLLVPVSVLHWLHLFTDTPIKRKTRSNKYAEVFMALELVLEVIPDHYWGLIVTKQMLKDLEDYA